MYFYKPSLEVQLDWLVGIWQSLPTYLQIAKFLRDFQPFLEAFASVLLIVFLIALYYEYKARKEEREAREEERKARVEEQIERMWMLATDPRPGNSGKIPALEYLNRKGHSLQGIEIRNAYLQGIKLPNAELANADLSGEKSNLVYADLSGAILIKTILSDAILIKTNLSRAILYLANLSGADLRDAKMSGAGLESANLSGADLSRANLSGADLTNTLILAVKAAKPLKNLTQQQLDQAFTVYQSKEEDLPDFIKPFDNSELKIFKNRIGLETEGIKSILKDQKPNKVTRILKECAKQAHFKNI